MITMTEALTNTAAPTHHLTRIIDDITIDVAEGALELRYPELVVAGSVAIQAFRVGCCAVLTELLERLEKKAELQCAGDGE